MADYKVGSVTVEVVPDARGFDEKVDAAVRDLKATVQLALDDAQVKAELDGVTRDRKLTVGVGVDTTKARAELDEVTRRRDADVHANADTVAATADLDKVAKSRTAKVTATLSQSDISAKLDALARTRTVKLQVEEKSGTASVKIAALAAATKKLQDAQANAASVEGRLNKLRSDGVTGVEGLRAGERDLAGAYGLVTVAQDGLKTAMGLGEDAAKGSESALSNLASTATACPPTLALVAAALTLTGPAAAAAAGGLTIAAGAAGAAALAFYGLKEQVAKGTGFGPELSGQIDQAKTALLSLADTAANKAGPGVVGAFAAITAEIPRLAPLVAGLSGDLGKALNITADGLVHSLQGLTPLLSDAGKYAIQAATAFDKFSQSQQFADFVAYARQELPTVAGDLVSVAKNTTELVVALQPLGDLLLRTVTDATKLVGPLAELATGVVAAQKSASTFDISGIDKFAADTAVSLATGSGAVSKFIDAISGFKPGVTPAEQEIRALAAAAKALGPAQLAATGAAGRLGAALGGVGLTAKSLPAGEAAAAASAGKLGAAIGGAGLQAKLAGQHMDALENSLLALGGGELAARAAARQLQAAYAAAGASIKTGGRDLNITTAKGRANAAALDQIATSALGSAAANLKNGASVGKVDAQLNTARNRLIGFAMRMGDSAGQAKNLANKVGLTSGAVDVLARKYGDLPTMKATHVTAPGATNSDNQVQNLINTTHALRDKATHISAPGATSSDGQVRNLINTTRELRSKSITIGANVAAALGNLGAVEGALAGLPSSKTITIVTRHQSVSSGSGGAGAGAGAGAVGAFAVSPGFASQASIGASLAPTRAVAALPADRAPAARSAGPQQLQGALELVGGRAYVRGVITEAAVTAAGRR